MKSVFSKYYQKFFKPGFFHGAIVAIGFTSLVSLAATNLPGYFIFSSGSTISSSEINSNFEKLAGTVLLKATFTQTISANETDFVTLSTCPTCHNFSKKILLSSASIGFGSILTATDNDVESESYNQDFSYILVPSDGWYEFRLISNVTSSLTGTGCSTANCSANVNAGAAINLVSSLSNAQNYSQAMSMAWVGSYANLNDSNSDGSFDAPGNIFIAQPPEIKKYYLKAGQVIYFGFNASYSGTSASVLSQVSNSNMDITIIKL